MSAKKVFGLRVFLFFFDYKKKKEFNLEKTKKILFIHSRGFIGDAIVSTGIYKILKDDNYSIDILAAPSNKIIFDLNNKDLNKIFILKKGIFELFKTAFNLKKQKYDLIIDLNSKITRLEFLLIKTINAKSVLSFDKRDFNLLNINMIILNSNYDFDKIHITNRYKTILNFFNIKDNSYLKYSLPIPNSIQNKISNFLKANKINKYICIAPFTSNNEKNMSDFQINEIYKFIDKNYPEFKIIFIGLPQEIERLKSLQNAICNNFEEFAYSIELVKNCNLLISTDTSFVHIASTFEKPTIALYRKLQATAKWSPNNINANIIISNKKDSIQDINPNSISEKIKEIIN